MMSVFTFSTDDRIEDFLEHYPDLALALRDLGMDPLADGGDTLSARCQDHGHDPDTVLCQFALAATKASYPDSEDWTEASIAELIAHIDACHHGYLRGEVPRLGRLMAITAGAQPWPETAVLHERWRLLSDTLMGHLRHAADLVFPMCLGIEHAVRHELVLDPRDLIRGMREMADEHAAAETELDALIALADQARPAPERDGYRQALVDGMRALRADLIVHDQEEEDILLPAVLGLQEVLAHRVVSEEEN